MKFEGKNMIQSLTTQIPFLLIIIGICVFISYEIYLASTNESLFKNNSSFYFTIIIIPLLSIFLYILYGYTLNKQELMIFYVILGLSLSILLIIYFLIYTNLANVIFNKYILYTLSLGIILVGLAIVYNVFSERFKKQVGWSGFFINMLFYIPCLIIDFIQYIIKESNETPRPFFILFIIEILLIIFFIYLLPLIKSKINENSILLLNDPIMLSGETRIDADLKDKQLDQIDTSTYTTTTNEITQLSQKFALSMWVYINPLSSSKLGYTKETNIFNYGNVGDNHHPQIVHKIDNNGTNIRFYLTNKGIPYDTTIPYQKWNNILLNYNGESVDIFINGTLNYTYLIGQDQPSFLDTDIIIIGQDNGNMNNDSLYGSMCNIVYYKNPLSNTDIIQNYNLLMYKNPPIQ
uniref:Uncharacterized protein n=1 Tax=viral metagenome TaxID=1070528 RepID=A0A6C0I1H2_9ZZZZ